MDKKRRKCIKEQGKRKKEQSPENSTERREGGRGERGERERERERGAESRPQTETADIHNAEQSPEQTKECPEKTKDHTFTASSSPKSRKQLEPDKKKKSKKKSNLSLSSGHQNPIDQSLSRAIKRQEKEAASNVIKSSTKHTDKS